VSKLAKVVYGLQAAFSRFYENSMKKVNKQVCLPTVAYMNLQGLLGELAAAA
jgi:hypothetical protein